MYKGVVPQFRRDGTIYQTDHRGNGEVPDERIPQQLGDSIAPTTGTSAAPTPRSFSVLECPSEYDFDSMEYTDLEDLAWQQEASPQPAEESNMAADKGAEEQLHEQQHTHLWEDSEKSTTPPGSLRSYAKEANPVEPIVYVGRGAGGNQTVERLIWNNQQRGATSSAVSVTTVVKQDSEDKTSEESDSLEREKEIQAIRDTIDA